MVHGPITSAENKFSYRRYRPLTSQHFEFSYRGYGPSSPHDPSPPHPLFQMLSHFWNMIFMTPQPKSIIQNVVPPHSNWVIFRSNSSQFSLKFYPGFHSKLTKFIIKFHWKLFTKTREIFHSNWPILIIKFHWLTPVPLFQMWSTFRQFHGQISLIFRGLNPNPLFQIVSHLMHHDFIISSFSHL